jgi:predicted transcriptional regulator
MSAVVTVELPDALRQKLERMAEQEGLSVSQLLVEAAETMTQQAEMFERVRREAVARDTRAGFEKVLAAVPDVEPENPDDRIE